MSGWPILSLTTFLPLVGALFILVTRGDDAAAVRATTAWALVTSGTVKVAAIILAVIPVRMSDSIAGAAEKSASNPLVVTTDDATVVRVEPV